MGNEKNPEREPKNIRLSDDCLNCDTEYMLHAGNAYAFIYTEQAECNNIVCICPNCQHVTRIFCDDATIETAVAQDIQLEAGKTPPHETWLLWCELKGIEVPKTYELTPRLEKLVGEFAMVMANCPDDLLFEAITEQPPKTDLPHRWV